MLSLEIAGSSAAPHLHFELRTSKNEFPQNGLHFGFDIVDDIAPIIREIKVEPRGKKKPSKSARIIYTHDLLNVTIKIF